MEKFIEETGDKSKDIEVLPDDIMLVHIKKAIKRFGKMKLAGVSLENVKVTVPLGGEE